MTRFDFQRIAVSALGALTLSAICLTAAAGPVRAATPATTRIPGK